ncbi:MAG TPA: DUF3662 and FHA domain-containing protein [Gaiellaceae bacterium]|nr:DUF3662 and FHA domain-containing protein [Gaiellaceae bacterium]
MVLKAIEQKIEALFEGVFGRAFRTNVQPVELARKLAKEMDDHRSVSVSRVYVPNEYTVYLSSGDREQFEGYENPLVAELEEYLAEHAQRERYAVLTPPRVVLETDDDLGVGDFGIATRMVQPRHGSRDEEEPDEQVESGATMVYKPRTGTQPVEDSPPEEEPGVEADAAVLSWGGQTLRVAKRRVVLGRGRDCDVTIDDPSVSRRHAELVQEGLEHWVVDLGSTNGIAVGGRRVQRARLEPGDTFMVGETEVTFAIEPD